MENHQDFLSSEAAKLRRPGADAPCICSAKSIASLQSCVFCIKALMGGTKTQRARGEKTVFDVKKIKMKIMTKILLLTLMDCRANLVQLSIMI